MSAEMASLDVATENLGFDFDIFYAGKDMGTIKIGAGAGNIPLTLITELQKLEGQAQPDPNKFMPLVQGIQVSRVACASRTSRSPRRSCR